MEVSTDLRLYFHLCLGLANGIFPSGFRTKILYGLLISLMHAMCPAHLMPPDLITLLVMKLLIMQCFSTSCHFVPLSPHILLSTLLPNAINLCSSRAVIDQVSHPYETTGETTDEETFWTEPYTAHIHNASVHFILSSPIRVSTSWSSAQLKKYWDNFTLYLVTISLIGHPLFICGVEGDWVYRNIQN